MLPENNDALLRSLLEQVSKLTEEVNNLKRDIPTGEELIKDISITKHAGFVVKPFKPKRKRGNGASPLLESEIKEAQAKAKSASQAAKLLNVSYTTYKKYAKLYNIHSQFSNRCGKGIPKPKNPNQGKYPLNDILAGKFPEYPLWKLKDRLIRSGLKQPCCEQCGYNERRITDNKIPLLLVFEDNNEKNHKIDNIKVFCYNCSFTAGKIWVKIRDRKRWLNDPDRLQGSPYDTQQRY
jgi:hypothetical protein